MILQFEELLASFIDDCDPHNEGLSRSELIKGCFLAGFGAAICAAVIGADTDELHTQMIRAVSKLEKGEL